MKNLRKILGINKYILLLAGAFVLALAIYVKVFYDVRNFEQLLYTIMNSEGTGVDSIKGGIIAVSIGTVLLMALFVLPFFTGKLKTKVYLNVSTKKKEREIPLSFAEHKLRYSVIVFFVSLVLSLQLFGLFGWLIDQTRFSTLYEDYYVEPKTATIKFPEKKRNLIHIFVESLETTVASKKYGGNQNVSYIPRLEQLARDNINFSNRSTLGGALQIKGTEWTVAGMIAQTTGINMKVDIGGNQYSGYSSFLGGATTIGDILKENGYKNYILMGSDSRFAGRNELFSQHGDYEMFDWVTARKTGKIPDDYKVWWGFEDVKLFDYAKEKLNKVSQNDEPFNVTLLTADTHFQDGYVEEGCPQPFNNQYANVYYCSDSMIADFVDWLKTQPYYENTTIVITGDHLTMQRGFGTGDDDYERTVFNTFINAAATPIQEKNRKFSSLDIFPTTLAALGAEIKDDRLALGTNLFSERNTLIEDMGFEQFNQELSMRSKFYNNTLLGDSYYEMQDNK